MKRKKPKTWEHSRSCRARSTKRLEDRSLSLEYLKPAGPGTNERSGFRVRHTKRSIMKRTLPAVLLCTCCATHGAASFAAQLRGGDVRERRLAKFRQNVARFRLYRLRFLQENMRFAAFFKIYQILKLKFLKFGKILQILRHLQFFAEISRKLLFFQTDFLRKF